ncbi:MAG: nickel-responsive transcriptional regulator NikR [Nitrospinae bacterium]|nr:nickel-responsive transcriptional regulator NikR [Nitrospinota bacterium]
MPELERLSFSIEKPLMEKLEKLIKTSGYGNRSEFIRDMIRGRLVAREWESDHEAVGTVTLVYNHHQRKLGEKLTGIQHHHHHIILAATHIHLDHDMCAEVIIARGAASRIRELADTLRRQKGVFHAELSMSSTGTKLA